MSKILSRKKNLQSCSVTIYDIAKSLGLSHTTVSLALRRSPKVKEKTRELVEKAAKRLGYRPNQNARCLKQGYLNRIALIIPVRGNYVDLIIRFDELCTDHGYEAVVMNLSTDPEKVKNTFEHILQSGFAAVAAFVWNFSEVSGILHEFSAQSRPIVILGPDSSFTPEPGFFSVRNSYYNAFKTLAERMIQLGHRKICFAYPGNVGYVKSYEKITQMIRELLKQVGTDYDPALIYRQTGPNTGLHDGYILGRTLHQKKPEVTACICIQDSAAIGLCRGLQETGIRVPVDFSVSGCGNWESTPYLGVSLSSVEMRFAEFAEKAWAYIYSRLQGGDEVMETAVLQAEAVIRESIGLAPQGVPLLLSAQKNS